MVTTDMSAAVLHGPGDLRIEARPVPEPGPDDVLVEVSHCGVCGTDLHMVVEGWGTPGSIGGHEWSGRVVRVGSDVTAFVAGDLVVGGTTSGCGACDLCRDDRPSLCINRNQPGGAAAPDGAFAHFICTSSSDVVAVPQNLDLRTAALAEPLAVALHAINQAATTSGQRALVTGAGPIGALVVVALRARGVTDIVVSEPNPLRQDLARRLGATVVEPEPLEVPNIAEPARIVDGAVDVAFECSGRADVMVAACAQLQRRGTLVLVGTGIASPSFDANRILLNELVITGAFEHDGHGIETALDLLASGEADVSQLIEPDDVGLDDLLEAMSGLAGGRVAGKVLVSPNLAPNNEESA